MIEFTTNELAAILIGMFVLGAIFAVLAMWSCGMFNPCKHEWEKVVDDTIVNVTGGCPKGHQIVFFCKKCGKYKSKKVDYDRI